VRNYQTSVRPYTDSHLSSYPITQIEHPSFLF
jgi:hypothetical protein